VSGEVVNLDDHRIVPLHMMTAGQEEEALAAIKAASQKKDKIISAAYQEFGDLVRAYMAANVPASKIAGAAELTRSRIYQIRDEK
jgi:hypothetical protein